MIIGRKFCGSVCAGQVAGALLPFVLLLFLWPEPADERSDNYLPSAHGRALAVKTFKAANSFQGGKSTFSSFDLAVVDQPQPAIIFQDSLVAELFFQLRHFAFLHDHLGRSPPANS